MKREQIITAAVIFLGLSAMVMLGSYIAKAMYQPNQKMERSVESGK